MAALILSWGSQSIEVRLLSNSEVMLFRGQGSKGDSLRVRDVVLEDVRFGSLDGSRAAGLARV